MRLVAFLLVVVVLVAPVRGHAQDSTELFRSFEAGRLSWDERRFLQAALAFAGDYNGLLDGDWGPLSQTALDRHARREFGEPAQDWHMAMLVFGFLELWDRDGWEIEYFDAAGLSFLVPRNSLVNRPPSRHFANWSVRGSSLAYSVGVTGMSSAVEFHDYTSGRHQIAGRPYMVRDPGLAITVAERRDGSVLYTRSDEVGRGWSTVMLSADRRDRPALNAVAASIAVGPAPPLTFREDGYLATSIHAVLDILEQEGAPAEPAPSPDLAGGAPGGSGSGFYVSRDGHVLTNAHVVEGCREVTVNGRSATVVGSSEAFDLALLRTPFESEGAIALFSPSPARLNSDVTVAGYPYAGILGGLNVTRGAVSSLRGLGGSETDMQITAPVQAGNSGGPVLGPDGEVVGVVVAKLDAGRVAEAMGDMPQNVNFAIRGEVAKLFLSQHGVEPELGRRDDPLHPTELADRAAEVTVLLECG